MPNGGDNLFLIIERNFAEPGVVIDVNSVVKKYVKKYGKYDNACKEENKYSTVYKFHWGQTFKCNSDFSELKDKMINFKKQMDKLKSQRNKKYAKLTINQRRDKTKWSQYFFQIYDSHAQDVACERQKKAATQ